MEKKAENDESMIRECQSLENFLMKTHFINGSVAGEFVELRGALDSKMTLEQKQLLFGWNLKERFIFQGEEILDASEMIKMKEEKIIKTGTGSNRCRMAARTFKTRSKK
jgi:hypothetical protein